MLYNTFNLLYFCEKFISAWIAQQKFLPLFSCILFSVGRGVKEIVFALYSLFGAATDLDSVGIT